MTRSAPVVVRGLRVVRGGRAVLPGLDAELPAGVVTGLLGPSGSGKTTLLRAIVGVQAISAGQVTVLGHPAGSAALRRRVGYSTQAPAVYQDLTVAENLRYFAAVRGDDPADAARVLALVGLTRYADRVAGRLSGGELGRASLAVALLGRSELLVLDEPTVGLDPVLRAELWDLFHRLAGEGVTLVVSSHVMDEAARCDELLLLRDGAILAQAAPAELMRRTATPDVEQAFLHLVGGSPAGTVSGREGAAASGPERSGGKTPPEAPSRERTIGTVRRVLRQLRHDRRTLALLLVFPTVLMVLLRYVFDDAGPAFDRIAPALLGIFPFTVMFLVTSVATLRERRGGTLERLMTTPMGRLDFLLGYGAAFGLVALVQVGVVTGVTLGFLGLDVAGSPWLLLLVAVLDALLGTALGLAVSAFARTEFQAVQFLPVVVLPQVLLCGLFAARDRMAPLLEWLSAAFPLTYAVEAMALVTRSPSATGELWRDVAVVAGASLLALALGAATLRRRTP